MNTVVIAIGGNSIIRPGDEGTIEQQWAAADETCRHVARVIKEGYKVVLSHGNGPQIGNILLRSEIASSTLPTLPLDVCGADSQGAMGYMLQQLLHKELQALNVDAKPPVTVITQVLVDANDRAFQNPSKPIGPFYSEEEAERHRLEDHWDIMKDANRGFRRVVASPEPQTIIEEDAIKRLIQDGFTVIAVGGGGLPVSRMPDGSFKGQAAVIDKDLASSLLACRLKADILLISTAVSHVSINFGTEREELLGRISLAEARHYMKQGEFAKGSMLPKVEAACRFIENGGEQAIITSPECISPALAGKTGTIVVKET